MGVVLNLTMVDINDIYHYISMVEPYRNMHTATLRYCTQPEVSPTKIQAPVSCSTIGSWYL